LQAEIEKSRKAQRVLFHETLKKLSETDLVRFSDIAFYVLQPRDWELVSRLDDLEIRRANAKRSKTKLTQIEYFKSSVIVTLLEMMVKREPGEAYSKELLEVMALLRA
jgi:hypothetical protein